MKITKKQLKTIIKEEIEAVMSESELIGIGGLGALKQQRAAQKRRAEKEAESERKAKAGGYVSSSVANARAASADMEYDRSMEKIRQQRYAKQQAEKAAAEKKTKREKEILKDLAAMKLELSIEQGCTDDLSSCNVYIDDLMKRFPNIYEMLDVAYMWGQFDKGAYDDDYTKMDLLQLFPGKYTLSQLPNMDEDSDGFYDDENVKALQDMGFMGGEDAEYDLQITPKGKHIMQLLANKK